MLNNIGKACTACHACESICPTKAISFKKDKYDVLYPKVDIKKCVHCNKCNIVCHIQNKISTNEIKQGYVGYSLLRDKNKSASGGICSALYQYCIEKDWNSFGVSYEITSGAKYIEICNEKDICSVRNSKYVYSDMSICFEKIKRYLKDNKIVLFIGLPCQVAAIKRYIVSSNLCTDSLYLIEIICHGIAPQEYLDKHIRKIERKLNKKADEVFFRDPNFGTSNYYFTLHKNGEIIYKQNVKRSDAYQLGYHDAIIYRENCYQCVYAQEKRVADLVLSDWYYDGKASKISFDDKNVSSILCCTDKGKYLLERMQDERYIWFTDRPLSEAFNIQTTLNRPHKKNKARKKFLQEYERTQDFDTSIKRSYRFQIIKNEIKYYLKINKIKQKIKLLFKQ